MVDCGWGVEFLYGALLAIITCYAWWSRSSTTTADAGSRASWGLYPVAYALLAIEDIGSGGLEAIPLLAAALHGLIVLGVALVRRCWGVLGSVVLKAAVLIGVLLGVEHLEHEQRIAATRQGNVIAHALEEYRTDHGEYPASLPGLVPEYLRALPTPCVRGLFMRREFGYSPISGGYVGIASYSLGFQDRAFLVTNRERAGGWRTHE